MTLEDWVAHRWLQRHDAKDVEVADLVRAARQDLEDAAKDLSPAWRFAIAYNAALRLATAALFAAGYRATREQKHYRTMAALPLLLGSEAQELADFLDSCRARRHEVTYEAVTVVTEAEAAELINAVRELDDAVSDWLRARAS